MIRAACLCLLLVPAARSADDTKADAAAIKGRWKVTAMTFNGADQPVSSDNPRVLMFDGKEMTAFTGGKKGRTLTYTLDPAANPKRIDLTLNSADQTSRGVYVLKGDRLTLCYGEPGADRPAKAESKPESKAFLLVLERVKE